tara:strand:+ start:15919 stop:22911 length:6993 start_codon:yes stop_codon:yes gene_type:complete
MPRVSFGFETLLDFPNVDILDGLGNNISASQLQLNFELAVGMGPMEFSIVPGENFRFRINDILDLLAKTLKIEVLTKVTTITSEKPWSLIFETKVAPSLKVLVSDTNKVISLILTLFEKDNTDSGVQIGGKYGPISIEPFFTVYEIIIGYDKKKGGMNLSARVTFEDQKDSVELLEGTYQISTATEKKKTEVVKFPFPVPDQGTSNFKINYVGLGQRFGPPLPTNPNDFGNALEVIFKDLIKNLTSNNPQEILKDLVKNYYHRDREWFVGVDVEIKGWQVRFIFNDPVLYGLQISCTVDNFKGLNLIILYIKLGPDLGVYYGKLTIPEAYRQLNFGAVALSLPNIQIWVYTNGDFLINIGWPLGSESIGIEVYIFTGGCGFYFGKLRSGDYPQNPKPLVPYNPIIVFGLGVWFGVGRSFRKGPLSASLSLTLQGTFQGILAWEEGNGAITKAPDYFWFASTVGVIGQLEGSVDLKIIKISILVRLSVTAGIAFETDYNTLVNVTANVQVAASVKILFIKITVSFSATISQTFILTHGGKGDASLNGPQNPSFLGMNGGGSPDDLEPLIKGEDLFTYPLVTEKLIQLEEEHITLPVSFVLYPAVHYKESTVAPKAVAILAIDNAIAATALDVKTPWEQLMRVFAAWLLTTYGSAEPSWKKVEEALNANKNLPPYGFEVGLINDFLAKTVTFDITGVDLASLALLENEDKDVILLPIFPNLKLTTEDQTIEFSKAKVGADFLNELQRLFAQFSISSAQSNGQEFAGNLVPEFEAGDVSLNAQLFTDYFLMAGRQLAQQMADEKAEQTSADQKIASNVGGFISRFLLHGVNIPTTIEGILPQSLYELSRQQFDVVGSKPFAMATLALDQNYKPDLGADQPDFSKLKINIAQGVATIPVEKPVSLPPAFPGIPEVLEPLVAEDMWAAVRERTPWSPQGLQKQFIIPIPPRIQNGLKGQAMQLKIQGEFPHAKDSGTDLNLIPALLINIKIHQIKNEHQAYAIDDQGTPLSIFLPNTFRISGTDDATRDLLQKALEYIKINDAKLSILYNADGNKKGENGYSSGIPDALKTVVLKSNLSTSSEPDSVFTPFRLKSFQDFSNDALGPVSATMNNVAEFLRILWENSIVNSSGFYLYYNEGTGVSFPIEIFNNGEANIQILVALPENTFLEPWCNTVVVPDEGISGALYLALQNANGRLVQNYQPNYPTGCISFDLVSAQDLMADTDAGKNLPYSADSIAQLYHMLQYQIVPNANTDRLLQSIWSPSIGPSSQGAHSQSAIGPMDKPFAFVKEIESYRQNVPIYNFLAEGQSLVDNPYPNVYKAVGATGKMQFRLVDVYGNHLNPESKEVDFTVLYTDQLISPAEWPGTHIDYQIYKAVNADNLLQIDISFDPSQVIRNFKEGTYVVEGLHPKMQFANEEDKKQQAEIAIYKLYLTLNQLNDLNTHIGVSTSLFQTDCHPNNKGKTIASDAALRSPLIAFVQNSIHELSKVLNGSGEIPQKLHLPLKITIDPKEISQVPCDILPLNVWFTLSRDKFLPTNVIELPKVKENSFALKPNLEQAPVVKEDGTTQNDVAMYAFATAFEEVFSGYDGSNGVVKIAKRTGNTNLSGTGNTSFLWIVKWSVDQGLHVQFEAGDYSYFTLAPLSNRLLTSEVAMVSTYNDQLDAISKKQVFTDIDVDKYALDFLASIDEILTPEVAAAVAACDAKVYANLLASKASLAKSLKLGLIPVFEDQASGDLESASNQFEQALLNKLSRAYTTSAVTQIPASVQISNPNANSSPPRIYGGVSPVESKKEQYTIGNGKLQIGNAHQKSGTEYLNFLVSAKNVTEQADLELDLQYDPIFIEHLIDEGDENFGYVPSTWLRFVLTGEHTPTQYNLGIANVPIPLRIFPEEPSLKGQVATGSKNQERSAAIDNPIEKALFWDYLSNVALLDMAAQDDLWFDLVYNLPISERKGEDLFAFDENTDPLIHLFRELAAFNGSYENLRLRFLQEVQAVIAQKNPEALKKILGVLSPLITSVADAYQTFMNPRDTDSELVPSPNIITRHFVLSLREVFQDKKLILYGDSDTIGEYPSEINGQIPLQQEPKKVPMNQAPDAKMTWYEIAFTYSEIEKEGVLNFVWEHIDAIRRQTAKTIFWTLRNSHLGVGNQKVNKQLVYQTMPVTYGNPAIPQIQLSNITLPALGSLAATLSNALEPFAKSGIAGSKNRLFKLTINYAYNLIDFMAQGSAMELFVPSTVRLAYDVNLVPNDSTFHQLPSTQQNEMVVSLEDFSTCVSKEMTAWYEQVRPSDQPITLRAQVKLDAILFAIIEGSQLPLVIVDHIIIPVPEKGWWPKTNT